MIVYVIESLIDRVSFRFVYVFHYDSLRWNMGDNNFL